MVAGCKVYLGSIQLADPFLWVETYANGWCQHDLCCITHMGCHLCKSLSQGAAQVFWYNQCFCNFIRNIIHYKVSKVKFCSVNLIWYFRPPFLFGYDPLFEFDNQYYIAGVIVFFGSVLFQSNVYILLRMLKGVHYSVTLSIFGLIGMLESAVFMFALGDGCIPACGEDR